MHHHHHHTKTTTTTTNSSNNTNNNNNTTITSVNLIWNRRKRSDATDQRGLAHGKLPRAEVVDNGLYGARLELARHVHQPQPPLITYRASTGGV